MKSYRPILLLLLAAAITGPSTALFARDQAPFVLQVHPIFTPPQAELVYQPLVDYLNEATEYRFVLQTTPDFHTYWFDIRRGQQPDFVLEDAHLIALRMERDGFIPLARADEPATFSLLTTDAMATEPEELIGRRIATMPAPSLGYLVLASWYPNPMQQPVLDSGAASWLDAVEIVFDAEADAAIVPHNLVRRYVNLTPVITSAEFPHQTLASSPEIPVAVRNSVTEALLELDEQPEHFGALHELDIQAFVSADPDEYLGLENWLELIFSDF